jgi:hypothetical protein
MGDHSHDLRRLDCRTQVTSVQIPGGEGGVATVTPSKIIVGVSHAIFSIETGDETGERAG